MSFALNLFLTAAILLAARCISSALYNRFVSPLSAVPGPILWSISRLPYCYHLCRGTLVHRIHELHDKYGPHLRVAPNEISFTDPQAWTDIYASRKDLDGLAFPKNPVWHSKQLGQSDTIMTAGVVDHARYRRLLSHAFSSKALKDQESVVNVYVELLMVKLAVACQTKSGQPAVVDMARWINFTTFDMTGDLVFGESFHCLESEALHGWVSFIFSFFKSASFVASIRLLGLESILMAMIPKSMMEKRAQHFEYVKSSVAKRLALAGEERTSRPDFMSAVLQEESQGSARKLSMSVSEIEATFGVLVMAGSETTATTLSACINYSVRNPNALARLTDTVRSTFKSPTAMTSASLENLEYLNAVINESLRLCAPIPCGVPRMCPPGGATVCGLALPAYTAVAVHNFSINRREALWHDACAFRPERWLGDEGSHDSDEKEAHGGRTEFRGDVHDALRPFSLGPRQCMGMRLAWAEMRLVVARLVWSFDLQLVQSREGEPGYKPWEEQQTYSLWDKDACFISLKERA